ncbi:MAG: type I phosphomannose isomerase catalytic subunit [Limnochordia bacterium]|jgi:mannose-6-phosphate isomerase|nr:class I mannose-6-phosphate isomerase [Limnochordia bacterium]
MRRLYPFTFIPVYKERIWGGTGLSKYRATLPGGNIGESWEISAHAHGASVVASGPLKGEPLDKLAATYPKELLGQMGGSFPLLLKLISARDTLSVQVHPGDHYAQSHENGSLGKHELWYILEAEDDAWIIYGLKSGVSKGDFQQAIEQGEVTKTLQKVTVQAGDVFDIPPGLVHALGPGVTLAEIQQSSDITYRVYDWDRVGADGKPRELHIEKALDVIDFALKPQQASSGLSMEKPGGRVNIRAANQYFAVEQIACHGQMNLVESTPRFSIYFVLRGMANLTWKEGETQLKVGDTVLVPAAVEEYALQGDGDLLRFYVPDLIRDILLPLKDAGWNKTEIAASIAGISAYL